MPIRVEVYTLGGIATGVISCPGAVRESLDGSKTAVIEGAVWLPLDGTGERTAGQLTFAVDDLLMVVADEPDGVPVHAQWHSLELDAGPYRVQGQMPTMPGFDPGRALARPSGEFVLLRDARIQLIDQPDAGEAMTPQLLVNRYTVDRIQADIMLGFFFPGAAMTVTGTPASASRAGQDPEPETHSSPGMPVAPASA
jgi:hypothetical protein